MYTSSVAVESSHVSRRDTYDVTAIAAFFKNAREYYAVQACAKRGRGRGADGAGRKGRGLDCGRIRDRSSYGGSCRSSTAVSASACGGGVWRRRARGASGWGEEEREESGAEGSSSPGTESAMGCPEARGSSPHASRSGR